VKFGESAACRLWCRSGAEDRREGRSSAQLGRRPLRHVNMRGVVGIVASACQCSCLLATAVVVVVMLVVGGCLKCPHSLYLPNAGCSVAQRLRSVACDVYVIRVDTPHIQHQHNTTQHNTTPTVSNTAFYDNGPKDTRGQYAATLDSERFVAVNCFPTACALGDVHGSWLAP
jgi:hypothetical protein